MPVVNPLARELVFKVVYYGPGLGGKTTTLQHIHAATKPEHRGKMVSLATPVDRTLYFDFLPIRVPHVRGMGVRLQLFTVPGQVYYNATRKLVLTGADGVVMVYDSQALRLDSNIESLENLCDNLKEHGRALADLPHVVQYNKRDLLEVSAIHELEPKLNRQRCPAFATVAIRGDGVFEALEAITRAVLEDFDRRMPEMRGTALQQLELPEGGLAEALRRAEGISAPPSTALISQAQSAPHRPSSSALRLSSLPEADPGEDAARAITATAARHATPPPPMIDAADVAPTTPRSRSSARDGTPPALAAGDGKAAIGSPAGKKSAFDEVAAELLSVEPPAPAANVEPERTPAPRDSAASGASAAAAAPSVVVQFEPTPASRIDGERRPRSVPPVEPAPPASVAAAVPLAPATGAAMSFEALWPLAERATVRELEHLLASANFAKSVVVADQLVARSLASAANMLGATSDAPRDPAVVALLLGIDGRRYLEFRALLREARAGRPIEPAEALAAFALAIDFRLARSKLGG